ncbi:MAG TPA: hypothetical protein VF676_08145 [Flavobacterium sp.]
MKTYYFNSRPKFLYSVIGLLGLLVASCGSYQNTSYNDNDGIYGDNQRKNNEVAKTSNVEYQSYFGSLQENNQVEIFTDVDAYRTDTDSTQTSESKGYESGYAAWGGDTDNVTVNVYGNNWGYTPWNYWYGPSYGWGWNTGWGWGYSGWYGPSFGIGWGWNSWYGPGYGWGWNNYYGNGWYNHHHHHYAYNNSIRGVRNEMYGRSNVGRRYTTPGTRSATYTSGRRNTISNGTRSTQYSTSGTRSYNNSGTRTPSSYNTPRSSSSGTRSYTPSSSGTRSYSSPSSSGSTRSYGGGGGGGSYGGGGGRSGGGGRR